MAPTRASDASDWFADDDSAGEVPRMRGRRDARPSERGASLVADMPSILAGAAARRVAIAHAR